MKPPGTPARHHGAGYLQAIVLAAVREGMNTKRAVTRRMKPFISGIALDGMLARLVADGYLIAWRNRYELTDRGHGEVPLGMQSLKPYTPPKPPPRRPGSDWSHLPSLMGGERVAHWSRR